MECYDAALIKMVVINKRCESCKCEFIMYEIMKCGISKSIMNFGQTSVM